MPDGPDTSTVIRGDNPVDSRIHFAPQVWPEQHREPGRLPWPLGYSGPHDAQIAQMQNDLQEAVIRVLAVAEAADDDVLQKIQVLQMAKDECLRGTAGLADHPSCSRTIQETLHMFESVIE